MVSVATSVAANICQTSRDKYFINILYYVLRDQFLPLLHTFFFSRCQFHSILLSSSIYLWLARILNWLTRIHSSFSWFMLRVRRTATVTQFKTLCQSKYSMKNDKLSFITQRLSAKLVCYQCRMLSLFFPCLMRKNVTTIGVWHFFLRARVWINVP